MRWGFSPLKALAEHNRRSALEAAKIEPRIGLLMQLLILGLAVGGEALLIWRWPLAGKLLGPFLMFAVTAVDEWAMGRPIVRQWPAPNYRKDFVSPRIDVARPSDLREPTDA